MAMLALVVPTDVANILSRIQVPGKREAKEDMHITILNLGDVTIADIAKATQTLFVLANRFDSIHVSVNSVSTFPQGPDGFPIICEVDSPQLMEFHKMAKVCMDEAGVEYSKKFPTFIPHITLAYSDVEKPLMPINTVSFSASEFYLIGGSSTTEKIDVRFPFLRNASTTLKVAARHQVATWPWVTWTT